MSNRVLRKGRSGASGGADRAVGHYGIGVVHNMEPCEQLMEAGDYEGACRLARHVVLTCRRSAVAWFVLGRCEQVLTNDFVKAKRYLGRALAIEPTHEMAWVFRGVVCRKLGELEEARECYSHALHCADETSWVHATLAEDLLWHTGQYALAEEHFLQAIELSPWGGLAQRDYARMLIAHGRHVEACRWSRAALANNPSFKPNQLVAKEAEGLAADGEDYALLGRALIRDPSYESARAILKAAGKI